MSHHMRICFVIPTLNAGGTERQLLYLLEGLAPHHQLTVICTQRAGDWADEAKRWARVEELGLRGGWDPRLGLYIGRIFRAILPDVVHSFLFGFDYPVNAAARKTGVPVVISSRRELASWMNPRHVRYQQKANHLVDTIVANSQVVAEFAIRQEDAPPHRFRVIPNGIPAKRYARGDKHKARQRMGIPENAPAVGMVANFSPAKDHDLFLASAVELHSRRENVHFLLAGTGPLRDSFERQLDSAGLRDQTVFAPPGCDVRRLYRALDLFVLTSKTEGFPNVLLEAMASGVPVVAPAVGGIPELVEDGLTGMLVPSRDPKVFASAWDKALSGSEQTRAMAARARNRVRSEFSVENMVADYRALYEELLAEASQTAEAG